MGRKVNKYDDFINEEVSFDAFKSLIDKVKAFIPKKQIQEFIQKNKAEVERVSNLLEDEKGNIDYKKAFQFAKENVKK